MPDPMPPRPLTLIVAATSNMGIGLNNGLPWPMLKREMAYFARVTKRAPVDAPAGTLNTVIMGRKTWESIPPRFRPLKGRTNIVVSRSVQASEEGRRIARSLEEAAGSAQGEGHVFVIGGSSVYEAALELEQARRVLLTKIRTEFQCDAFFPLDLEGEEAKKLGWVRKSRAELEHFVGETLEEEVISDAGVEFEFCLFEKE